MKWRGREQSQNVEDRRGGSGKAVAAKGGGLLVIVVMLVAAYFGFDPRQAAQLAGLVQNLQAPAAVERGEGVQDDAREFISVVLRDNEKVWTDLFRQEAQARYVTPKLVIFDQTTDSLCGAANAATGPFYCPADLQIYISPGFFDQLHRELGAPGDFAQAYVIAHEVAHHVQNLLGYMQIVERLRRSGDNNRSSVRLELQADYLAGVWAHHAERNFGILDDGDLEEAINAANSIGDDRLQRMSQGFVIPERYTHGTSAQRVKWFKAGLKSGDVQGAQQLFDLPYERL